MKLHIGVDIDSTLNKGHLTNIINGRKFCKEHGIKPNGNINLQNIEEMFGFNDSLKKLYLDQTFPSICKYCPVEDGASEVMRILKRGGHKISIVTARDDGYVGQYNGKMMVEDTLKWLSNNGIIYDNIFFGCRDKYDACIKNDIDILIDDDPKHICECSENGIPVIISAQPYNEYLLGKKNTYYSKNWMETLRIISSIT